MKKNLSFYFLFLVLPLLLFAVLMPANSTQAISSAVTCYVKWDASGGNNGTSWTNAYTSLQSALGDNQCTEIWVAAGGYSPGTSRADTFQLKNGLEIYGGFSGNENSLNERNPGANLTTLYGSIGTSANTDNIYHVITANNLNSSAVLDGFRVAHGYANDAPSNTSGGGMLIIGGAPTIRNVEFIFNSAINGGGMSIGGESSTTLTNVTFRSNAATYGGGVYVYAGSNPVIKNATFAINSASASGGGIYIHSSPISQASPAIYSATFTMNTANYGGGVAKSSYSNPTIINSILWGNTAGTDGAQIYGSSGVVAHSVVQGGYPGGSNIITTDPLLGADVDDYGGFTWTVPIFYSSSAINAADNSYCLATDQRGVPRLTGECDMGAYEFSTVIYAIEVGKTTGTCQTWRTACTLKYALTSVKAGQEIWVQLGTHKPGNSRSDSFLLKNNVEIYGGFAGNETAREQRDPDTYPTWLSGEINDQDDRSDNSFHVVNASNTDATAVLDGVWITRGYAELSSGINDKGGGLYIGNGSATLRGLNFFQNYADYGGGMYISTGHPILENFKFWDNDAIYGGGMYNHDSQPELSQGYFDENSAEYGGGVYNYASSPTLIGVSFQNNNATESSSDACLYHGSGSGAGMYNAGASMPNLTQVVFDGNIASCNAGGVFNSNSILTMQSGFFVDNKSSLYGGGIANFGSGLTLNDVDFEGNNSLQGGGIHIYGSNPTITDCNFNNNSAVLDGGGIFNDGSSPSLSGVTFNSNTAEHGGGMHNTRKSNPTLNNVIFNDNQADKGAGLYNGNSNPKLTMVTFTNNVAAMEGGGIYNVVNGTPELTNVIFNTNSANYGGGMYIANDGGMSVLNAEFSGNTAFDKGGGIYVYQGAPIIRNVTFNDNSANSGGAISYNNGNGSLTNVTITGNHASFGGGLEITNSNSNNLKFTHVTITENTASSGGGIYILNSTPTIHNSILWGNTSASGSQAFIQSGIPVMDYNVIQEGCPTGAACSYILTNDPKLGTLGSYGGNTQTLSLLAGSSAIDSASNSYCYSTDQRGISRPQGVRCDIGAFESRTFQLNVSKAGSGSGTVSSNGIACGSDCVENYPEATVITLTASAEEGSLFTGWNGACSGTVDCVLTIDQSKSVTANFDIILPGQYVLSVSLSGTGSGIITGTGINCFNGSGADCSEIYLEGTLITLTASADTGSFFTGWSEGCSGTGSCQVSMTQNRLVTAIINKQTAQHTIFLPLAQR